MLYFIHMIKKEILLSKIPFSHSLKDGTAILDITTDGRYWRTSRLLGADLIRISTAQDIPVLISWISEKEQDEYDILTQLFKEIENSSVIITYNGTAFDVPHLTRKAQAYALFSPFSGKEFRDLFIEYKPLAILLGLPSRRLEDFSERLPSASFLRNDAERLLAVTCFDSFISFFRGSYRFVSAALERDVIIYSLSLRENVPFRVSLPDGPFYIILEGGLAKLSVRIIGGKLRRYYTNIKDYDYLPAEGCAIHKSMSAFVEKNRKEKAVRTNCFTLINYSGKLLEDNEDTAKYISSVLEYLYSR